MTTTIERSLARLAIQIDAIENKLDAMIQASAPPSMLTAAVVRDIGGLFAATAGDSVAGAAARLRALHNPTSPAPVSPTPFGKPAPSIVIDGEFTEMKSEGS